MPRQHLGDWRPTKDTLHLYAQIVGKIRLATTAPRNHWWNAPLYVDVRGLTTRRLHRRGTTFEIAFDFVDHALVIRTADGRTRSFELGDGVSVAAFDAGAHSLLAELGIDVDIKEEPFGLPMTTPFPQDVEHASWDRDAIERFGRILDWSDSVFEEFSGWFDGKTSPVHLFWHSLDLAVTRFSGRPGATLDADPVTKEAYSEELTPSASGPATTPSATPPTTRTPPPSRRDSANSRWPSVNGSSPAPARSQSCRMKRSAPPPTPERRCSPSARAHTRPARASPAGTRAASSRPGAQPPANSNNCKPRRPPTSAVSARCRGSRCGSCPCRSSAAAGLRAGTACSICPRTQRSHP